jgi:hypothetical protein
MLRRMESVSSVYVEFHFTDCVPVLSQRVTYHVATVFRGLYAKQNL